MKNKTINNMQEKKNNSDIKLIYEKQASDSSIHRIYKTKDENTFETVLIPNKTTTAICISSQIGCPVGCPFCYTGKIGFKRNLTTEEIINQVIKSKEKPDSILYMGQGEPMLNIKNVISSIIELNILGFSQKKITVSTTGYKKEIEELKQKTRAKLAISLHATTDKKRKELIPSHNTIKEIIEITNNFPRTKKEKVMICYMLIKNYNDSKEELEELGEMFDPKKVLFNLSLLNPISKEARFQPSTEETIQKFKNTLIKKGYKTFIRYTRGAEIKASCGQLNGLIK